ncbi:MAG TPA: hypothetical protein VG271_15500 [Beijerinckiaceae bacterium]|nr:hypothetical protein [Beijerinckiaceae bacterium]
MAQTLLFAIVTAGVLSAASAALAAPTFHNTLGAQRTQIVTQVDALKQCNAQAGSGMHDGNNHRLWVEACVGRLTNATR